MASTKNLTPNYLIIYIINSEIVFVVCVSRTIFGKKSKVHVHLEGWKHGNRDCEAKQGVYAVAVVMVAMASTCTCNCQVRCGSAFL